MKSTLTSILGIIGIVVVLVMFSFAATGFDFAMFKFWAPKYENAKTEVFHNTQGYQDGKIAYISTLRLQYQTTDGNEKKALRTLIISEASTIDNNKLPLDLQTFINDLKGQ